MKSRKQTIWMLALAIVALPLAAEARTYTVIDLNPSGFTWSQGNGISGGQQVGWGSGPTTGNNTNALLWSGTAASVVDLHPSGFLWSDAWDISGGQQVGDGYNLVGTNVHALLWSGTAASAVDLNPSGFSQSVGWKISGGQQVGHGYGPATGNNHHALLWSGTAASAVDLNPSGFTASWAGSVSGGQQSGRGYGPATGNNTNALLWSGTAASVVNLNPSGFDCSDATWGMSGGQQSGYGYGPATSNNSHALLWSGTAASVVDLNPGGFILSQAWGMSGGQQVGWGSGPATGNNTNALWWAGTAASAVNLQNFLPSNYTASAAEDIDTNGDIVGWALNSSTGQKDAILWVLVPDTNAWISASDGKWETATNWSLAAAPSVTDLADLITNAGNNTVTIDAITTNFPSTMTISNLLVSANTLSLANAGTNVALCVLNLLTLTNGATLLISNATLAVTNTSHTAVFNLSGGAVTLLPGGTILADQFTNAFGNFNNLGGTLFVGGAAHVDQGTQTVSSGSTTVSSNLFVGSTLGATGTVNVTGGTLTATGGVFAVGNDGTLFGTGGVGRVTVSSGLVQAASILIGDSFGSDSSFAVSSNGHVMVHGGLRSNGIKTTTINGGTLEIVDGPPPPFEDPALHDRIVVSYLGDGRMIVSNGTVLGVEMVVGLASGEGTLEMAGGTVSLSSNLLVGMTSTATGIVTITGGSIIVTNGVFGVGNDGTAGSTGGVAHVTVSNGVVEAASILVGDTAGSDCSLTVAGTGYVQARGGLRSNGIKTTLVNGGTLEVVDGPPQPFEDSILHDRIVIGYLADGKLVVSNGLVNTPGMLVGASAGNTGTLELAGGSTSVFSNMTVGFVACSATGVVNVVGGDLFVTNAAGNAVLEVRDGTFTVSSGFVMVDKLVVTNACARLLHTGGMLFYQQLVLAANQSAVGDGIHNWWKEKYGFDPLDPSVANADYDGTGQNNLFKYVAGLDPTNRASVFVLKIASVTGQPSQKNLIFNPEVSGRTYTPQFRTNLTSGAWVALTGFTGPVTNVNQVTVTDLSATNQSKFYRIDISLP